MINVSKEFKKAIYAPERTTKAKVSFEILNLKMYEGATVVVSDEAEISKKDQLMNRVRLKTHRYATFERDYFTLDGSAYIPPKPTTTTDSELGWYSNVFSDANGTFATAPTIEITLTQPFDSVGLSIEFDVQANEYATDFVIEVLSEYNTVLHTENVTNNTNAIYSLEQALEGYKKVKITINKWVKAGRRAKIVEVDFGLIEEYEGDKLISLRVLEEMDLLANTVPSSELEFTLDNSDNHFNILNPNGIYRFLKHNQEMSAQIGLKVDTDRFEYINMGKYYLNQWTVQEGSMTSTFIGRDIFSMLEKETYTNLLQATNLYDLAVDVLGQANVKDYIIADALKDIATEGFKEAINTREALQMIAIAAKSVIRQDRTGSVILEQFDSLVYDTGYITFTGTDLITGTGTLNYTGLTTPETYIDYGFQIIDFDTAFQTPRIELATDVASITFNIYQADGTQIKVKYVNANVEKGEDYEISNPLINTEIRASEIAEWMFREYNLIAEYHAYWRQNPAFECGDIILIEDTFGESRKSRIIKQEFNFSGYLDGITETKGGV